MALLACSTEIVVGLSVAHAVRIVAGPYRRVRVKAQAWGRFVCARTSRRGWLRRGSCEAVR